MTEAWPPDALIVLTRADTSEVEKTSSSDRDSITGGRIAPEFEWLRAPMLALDPVDPETLTGRFDAGRPYGVILLTSPAAARVALDRLGQARLSESLCVAPGRGTAQILDEAGLQVVHPEKGGTSEDVLDLPELSRRPDRSIVGVLILAASGGRTLIARTLVERGADVSRAGAVSPCSCSSRTPGLLDALAHGRFTITLGQQSGDAGAPGRPLVG
jgi:hypothetical protein